MNRDDAKTLAPIVKAYGDNKEIEWFNGEEWVSCEYSVRFSDKPEKYRIKPQLKLVPFTFEDSLCGKVIVTKDNNNKALIIGQMQDGVYTGTRTIVTKYSELLKNFEFEDGSPCGKYISE